MQVIIDKQSLVRMSPEEIKSYLRSKGLDTDKPFMSWNNPCWHYSRCYDGEPIEEQMAGVT